MLFCFQFNWEQAWFNELVGMISFNDGQFSLYAGLFVESTTYVDVGHNLKFSSTPVSMPPKIFRVRSIRLVMSSVESRGHGLCPKNILYEDQITIQ